MRANPNSPNPNPDPNLSQVPSMRIAPFCRLVHLATMDFVFKVLVLIPPVIPPFATIFVIYVGAYTLVAWVMCLLLDDMDVPLGRCEAQARTLARPVPMISTVPSGFPSTLQLMVVSAKSEMSCLTFFPPLPMIMPR